MSLPVFDRRPIEVARIVQLIDREPAYVRDVGLAFGADGFAISNARTCGHSHCSDFSIQYLCTYKRGLAHLTGMPFSGDSPAPSAQ